MFKKIIVTLLFLIVFMMVIVRMVEAKENSFEEEVIQLVNEERVKNGLEKLVRNENLTKIAYTKAEDMIQHNYFDHISPNYGSPFQMVKKFGIRCTVVGENIAKGQQTPEEVMEDWLNSPSHKRNILYKEYEYIGVAYKKGLWIQLFMK